MFDFSSKRAICFFAIDYTAEPTKLEHFALEFKLEESAQNFKRIFEEYQANARRWEKWLDDSDCSPNPTKLYTYISAILICHCLA